MKKCRSVSAKKTKAFLNTMPAILSKLHGYLILINTNYSAAFTINMFTTMVRQNENLIIYMACTLSEIFNNSM